LLCVSVVVGVVGDDGLVLLLSLENGTF